jgi:hypothetical protein
MVAAEPTPNLLTDRLENLERVSDRFGWDASFGVHRFGVPLGPHACLESLVSPINQVAYVTKEDDARVLVLTNHLYVFAEKILVYVSRPEVRVADGPDAIRVVGVECFCDSGYSHNASS